MNEIFMPKEVKIAINKLNDSGFEAYIVGGCVRDSLLGDSPKDYDITTSASPEETERVFKGFRIIETGIKHGTVTVIINKAPLEITTFRIDSEYEDNRRPKSVTFTKSLEEDTARRDFTMNAIAYSEKSGLCDFYGGCDDIRKKTIRCVGDPNKRFEEDALRIMRALRFSSVLGFKIDNETKQAVFSNCELLRNISSERIASELIKLLCGKNVRSVLNEYSDVLGVVVPELLPMVGFEQHNIHHIYDVYAHTAAAVESIEPTPVLRLTALFHDLGKPQCFFMKNGQGHFYGHAARSADMADKILKRLKFDNVTRTTVVNLVRLHDLQIEDTESAVKRCLSKNTPEIFFLLLKMKRADTKAQASICRSRLEYLDRLEEIANGILNAKECFSLKDLQLKGNDLLALGFAPGKKIGIILAAVLEEVIAGRLPNDKDILVRYVNDKWGSDHGF